MKNILVFFLIALLMDGVFGVSVTEGDSVTLHTGLSEIQKDDVIQWWFKTDLIAQFDMENKKISLYDGPGGRFKDRLKLDSQTGDLTIRNIRTEHAGAYEVSNLNTLKRSFSVSVVPAAAVKPVSVLEGYSVTLNTDPSYIHDVMQWRYDQQKSPVAEINGTAGIFNTYDDVIDGRFRGRLKLDQTGSLTIKNITNTHSGLYEVEIISTRSSYTIHHTQSFTVTVRAVPGSGLSPAVPGSGLSPAVPGSGLSPAVPGSGLSPAAVAGIVVGVLLVAAAVAVVVIYRRRKISELESQREENGQNHKKQNKDEETKLNDP